MSGSPYEPDDDNGEGNQSLRSRYAPGNTRADGSYRVGKGRPPEQTRFRANDGRKRGCRPKGQANFETDLKNEVRRKVPLRENGKERRVTKQQAMIIRTIDNAVAKGSHQAARLMFDHLARIGSKETAGPLALSPDDDNELNAWLADRLDVLGVTESATSDEERDGSTSCPSSSEVPTE